MQSGFQEKLLFLAFVMFAMMYNATFRGADSFTPWQCRYHEDPPFEIYPFGALVFYKHPEHAPVPAKKRTDKSITKK